MRTDIDLMLRYLGAENADGAMRERASAAALEAENAAAPRTVYRCFPLAGTEEGFLLEGSLITLTGGSAKRMLTGCHSAVLLLGTLGFPFEAALRTAGKTDVSRALLLDAAGSAYLEAVLDDAEEEIKKAFPGGYLTDRFSPGYGDLPLSLQPAILQALGAEKRTGVHANEAFMMTPSKSVTAVIGIADEPRPARIRGCAYCSMNTNCPYHKKGGTCHA